MAGTVVLDDVELREAQRDYLDFLDDEVREAWVARFLSLEPREGGRAEGGHAEQRRGREGEARQACKCRGRAGGHRSLPLLSNALAVESVLSWFSAG